MILTNPKILTLLSEVYFLLVVFCLAAKDGLNYRLKATDNGMNQKINTMVKKWHWIGAALYLIIMIPCYFIGWESIVFALLIRFTFFDLFFNSMAGLKLNSFGTTAGADNINVRIFGKNGAIEKFWLSFSVLIILNYFFVLK